MRKDSKTDSIPQFDFMLRLFALLYRTKQNTWPKTVYILVSANSGKILIRLPSSFHTNTARFVSDIMIAELPKGSFKDAHFWKAYDSVPIAFSFGFISSFSINIFNKKVEVTSLQCCLKRRQIGANIFHVLPLASA